MSRLGIADLPHPGPTYLVTRVPAPAPGRLGRERSEFESQASSRREDLKRARGCFGPKLPPSSALAARVLGQALQSAPTPRTLASFRYWRRIRIRLAGGIWKLVAEGPWDSGRGDQVAMITVAPRSWELTPAELAGVRGERLIRQLRTWLDRAGAAHASGFLIACLHGDFETGRGVYRVHVHGVAAGGMIAVVDSLRELDELNPELDPPVGLDDPPARVHITRKPISNLVYTLTYQLKGYWPATWIGPVGDSGKKKRSRRKWRIPQPHHTELLLWFDQHRLPDITLLMKIRVGRQGFVPTRQSLRGALPNKE